MAFTIWLMTQLTSLESETQSDSESSVSSSDSNGEVYRIPTASETE